MERDCRALAAELGLGLRGRRVLRRVGVRRAAMAGEALAAAAYTLFGLADQAWILFVGIALQSLSAISGPAIQALVSERAGANEQGRMQGALSSFQGLTAIGSPLLAGWVFGVFSAPSAPIYLPGAPFFMAALAYGLAFWAVLGLSERR